MNKINYKSDFDFILPFPVCRVQDDGTCKPEEIGWPDFDWSARLWASSKSNVFVASRKGSELTNCYEDKGRIHIVCNNHHLGKGVLNVEIHAELPDGIYPDNVRDVFSPHSLGIELVDGSGDCATDIEVEYMLPYLKGPKGDSGDKGDKGDAFTYDDFTEAQIEELQRPATEAAERADEAADNAKAVADEYAATLDSKADRSELGNVYAEEPLTPENFPDINRYTREQLKKDLFIDQWKAAWGAYGGYDAEATDGHPFLGNDLRMTYEEALEILCLAPMCKIRFTDYTGAFSLYKSLRTIVPIMVALNSVSLQSIFSQCVNLEVVRFTNVNNFKAVNIISAFYNCKRLKRIEGLYVSFQDTKKAQNAFLGCDALMVLELSGLSASINLTSSPYLSLASFEHMLVNAANTTAIVITVHPDVYAKLTGDTTNDAYNDLTDEEKTQWTALIPLAAEKNITFATV